MIRFSFVQVKQIELNIFLCYDKINKHLQEAMYA